MADKKQREDSVAKDQGKGKGKSSKERDIAPAPTVTDKGAVIPQKVVDHNNNTPNQQDKDKGKQFAPKMANGARAWIDLADIDLPDFKQMAQDMVDKMQDQMMSDLGLEKIQGGGEHQPRSGTLNPDLRG